jgi:hypothetical protein
LGDPLSYYIAPRPLLHRRSHQGTCRHGLCALQDYFPTGRFHLISIPFDLGTDITVADWPTVVGHRLKTISSSYQQVVIVVTNHTDEDTRDMFLGADEMGKGHAAEVDQVCFV